MAVNHPFDVVGEGGEDARVVTRAESVEVRRDEVALVGLGHGVLAFFEGAPNVGIQYAENRKTVDLGYREAGLNGLLDA
jgi:hypothetical protein